MPTTAVIILADGFEEIEATTPVDLLKRANIPVTIIGLASRDVRGAHGICVKAEKTLGLYDRSCDALILPGGQPGTANLKSSEQVRDLVRHVYGRGGLCAAICAAPSVFGAAGILTGKKATCYPGVEKELAGATYVPDNVVVDGTVITGRGAGAAIDFSLAIITSLMGKPVADDVSKQIVYSR